MKRRIHRPSHRQEGLQKPSAGTKIVMVVEDDATHRAFMEEILRSAGFITVPAESGVVALARLETGLQPDFIIMDWDMPEMDGLQTTQRIRRRQALENLPHIPILAFTGNRLPGDREKCIAAGMDAYLPKTAWMPKWRQTLFDNLQGLITGDFNPEDFEDNMPQPSTHPMPANFNLDEFNMAILKDTKTLLKNNFAETVQEYLEDAATYTNRISEGLSEANAEKIAKASHPLKSNSKGFGLMAVAGLAEAINLAGLKAMDGGGTLEPVASLLPQLQDALERASKKLRSQI